jgi:hypothetical protein
VKTVSEVPFKIRERINYYTGQSLSREWEKAVTLAFNVGLGALYGQLIPHIPPSSVHHMIVNTFNVTLNQK